ncbi:hypothetical protein GWK47_003786 [Chionoecetes opilio]|uniref:Uncharacterized protein n=1 Tax=Chionoecetes opilio TaxID=41210 RepID=A0A8J4YHJ4_CHIOP|nr:hypothetical protein GWK47_003786 [Chionoecetes opilio]
MADDVTQENIGHASWTRTLSKHKDGGPPEALRMSYRRPDGSVRRRAAGDLLRGSPAGRSQRPAQGTRSSKKKVTVGFVRPPSLLFVFPKNIPFMGPFLAKKGVPQPSSSPSVSGLGRFFHKGKALKCLGEVFKCIMMLGITAGFGPKPPYPAAPAVFFEVHPKKFSSRSMFPFYKNENFLKGFYQTRESPLALLMGPFPFFPNTMRGGVRLARSLSRAHIQLCGPQHEGRNLQRICEGIKGAHQQETERETTAGTGRQWRSMRRSAPTHLQSCFAPTQADQENDLEEDIKKTLLAWKRSKEATRKKSHFPAKYRDQWGDPLYQVQHWDPKLSSSGAIISTLGTFLRPKRTCLSEDNLSTWCF